MGPQARGLSSSEISRLKQVWTQEYEEWSRRELRGKRFVYLGIDGIYCQARMEEEKHCLLVAIGADAERSVRQPTRLVGTGEQEVRNRAHPRG